MAAEAADVSPREATGFEHRWLGMEGIFGGFVLGRVVDAADALDGFSPQAVTTHFVGAIRPGEVEPSPRPSTVDGRPRACASS